MNSIRSGAEVYANGGAYAPTPAVTAACSPTFAGGGMFSPANTNNIAAAIANATSTSGTAGQCAVGTSGNTFAVSVALTASTTESWCVDNNGSSKLEFTATPALGGGSSAVAQCP